MSNIDWNSVINYLIKSVVPAVVVLIVACVVIAVVKRALKSILTNKKVDESVISGIILMVRWCLWITALLAAVTILKIGVGSLWTFLSAVLAMAAIGFFAGWSLISSSLAMLIIVIWRPYKVGDMIELVPDGISGHLTQINLMFCKITEEKGNVVMVPNSQMLQKVVRRILAKA